MFLFIGLGNPGDEYVNTPHNAGFLFVEHLREFFGWDSLYEVNNWQYDKYLSGDISIAKSGGQEKLLFMKPMTFMNKSGVAVDAIVKRYELDIDDDVVIAHDDLDIDLGKYKIQKQKSPKAHNGLESVHRHIGSNFIHVRLGIENRGELRDKIPGETYVLRKYSDDELVTLNEVVTEASRGLRTLLEI